MNNKKLTKEIMEGTSTMEKELKAMCENIKVQVIKSYHWKSVEIEQEHSLETADEYIIVIMEDESILVTARLKYTKGITVSKYLEMIDDMLENNECGFIDKCSDEVDVW
ncbi:hypothetical protein LL037_21525 [Clostridium estertheticum]|uniref:hypothetical protein n=1 Tax=Clostridium estertheticum TaxID=238834 RepID=UPI001C0B0187|nr:hypothetical protein [Clostridium estertheticum]MBU3198324.1 hypothetical protein [Clostridium estertheticum]WAG65011.1 hypothetical protein LL037_21525 [Clostridium estertheticum]